VEAGVRLGVDVIQIDDGWMRGRTSNSARGNGVWSGYWAADPQFWDVDQTRFPRGLNPVIQMAADKGMKFGLWFGPDSSNDFSNWEKDAAKIVELHRTLGVNYIKIDGVKAVSKPGERNLRAFFDRVLQESNGAVTFDLDVTAETRPGYYGMVNVGPLFVENRYTDWHRYWPHQTLRNLWKLSQYVDPLRLRMEFLNNTRNPETYPDDPLAPAAYSPCYLFATTMFANPLGWFEVSNLPANYFTELPALVAQWKKERAAMLSGTVIPIGQAPDGTSWTGFLSVSADRRSGYALIFRERNPNRRWQFDAPMLEAGEYNVTTLHGDGSAILSAGQLAATIPGQLQFLWVRLERKK
jgi:alpha-galactosidase